MIHTLVANTQEKIGDTVYLPVRFFKKYIYRWQLKLITKYTYIYVGLHTIYELQNKINKLKWGEGRCWRKST